MRTSRFPRALGAALLAVTLAAPGCSSGDPDDNAITAAQLQALGVIAGCADVQATAVGDSETGTLTAGECTMNTLSSGDNSLADFYAFRLESSREVQIDLEAQSGDINPYLFLFSSSGTQLMTDNNTGGDLDARITQTLGAGLYLIAANTFAVDETGSYRLTISD